jgi:integrase
VDDPLEPWEVNPEVAAEFWEWFSNHPDISKRTRQVRISIINNFFETMAADERFSDHSPFHRVIEEVSTTYSGAERREISIPQMRSFFATVGHIRDLTVLVLLAVSGIRAGELCNLDLRDVHIDHPEVRYEYGDPRGAIAGHPDTLFIPGNDNHEIIEGKMYNGEQRQDSNKRKISTRLPLCPELKHLLIRWLACRPDTPFTNALFVKTDQKEGHRMTTPTLRARVRKHVEPYGWYKKGGGTEYNVTPHYFRHFFSTYFSDAVEDPYVTKVLRGDADDDILDTYRHNWNGKVRDEYLNNIYTLLDDHPRYGIN